MPLSIWEYLRERTRDAVLAGFKDALDIVEQGDTEGSQHLAAKQLVSRFAQPEGRLLPAPSVNGNGTQPTATATEAPSRPTEAAEFDDAIERRLSAAASQSGPETPPQPQPIPPKTGRRPRGRPPKNGGNRA